MEAIKYMLAFGFAWGIAEFIIAISKDSFKDKEGKTNVKAGIFIIVLILLAMLIQISDGKNDYHDPQRDDNTYGAH